MERQWRRCGVSGDPYDGPRDHEAGGKYATGTIVKRYRQGQTITVKVQLTQSHKGYFEFRMCPNNNPAQRVTQECLDLNLLRQTNGRTRYQVTSVGSYLHTITLQLPAGLTCSQCVLQWKYNTGNSWGCSSGNSGCCVGCGRQEQFYGCSDIAISSSGGGLPSYLLNNNNYNNNVGSTGNNDNNNVNGYTNNQNNDEINHYLSYFKPFQNYYNSNSNSDRGSGYIPISVAKRSAEN